MLTLVPIPSIYIITVIKTSFRFNNLKISLYTVYKVTNTQKNKIQPAEPYKTKSLLGQKSFPCFVIHLSFYINPQVALTFTPFFRILGFSHFSNGNKKGKKNIKVYCIILIESLGAKKMF